MDCKVGLKPSLPIETILRCRSHMYVVLDVVKVRSHDIAFLYWEKEKKTMSRLLRLLLFRIYAMLCLQNCRRSAYGHCLVMYPTKVFWLYTSRTIWRSRTLIVAAGFPALPDTLLYLIMRKRMCRQSFVQLRISRVKNLNRTSKSNDFLFVVQVYNLISYWFKNGKVIFALVA